MIEEKGFDEEIKRKGPPTNEDWKIPPLDAPADIPLENVPFVPQEGDQPVEMPRIEDELPPPDYEPEEDPNNHESDPKKRKRDSDGGIEVSYYV